MFHFFSRRNTGVLPIKPADIRKGMVLTHLPTGTRRTAVHAASSGLLLIDDNGHLFGPSEKELAQQYCLLGSVTIPILIHSKGYGGQIRQDNLEIRCCPYTGLFWTDAWFINDWTGSWYSFDTDRHWPVQKQYLLKYLEDLLILCGKR